METNAKKLDVSTLEGWLWEAACVIRGPVDAPKFKDYILPPHLPTRSSSRKGYGRRWA